METVAETNETKSDDVVSNKLLEVFARLLHAKNKNNGLLQPVCSREEVIELDDALLSAVRVVLVHAGSVEVPNGRSAHHVEASGAENAEINGRVGLLHEASLLRLWELIGTSQGAKKLLHDELAREGQDDSVEQDESNVPQALAVENGCVRVIGRLRVSEEDESVNGVQLVRLNGVCSTEKDKDEGREDEGVFDHGLADARGKTTSAAAAREALGRSLD